MRHINRSALVPFSPEAMFKLVSDVDAYPEFLPWCAAARVMNRANNLLEASLTIGYSSLNSQFTTRNEFVEPDWMTMKLVKGPFSDLQGKWTFEQLGNDGCEVTLAMEFEFSNPMKDLLFGATFQTICNELIDAFVKRAHQMYD
jgi:ribosome-associated toxin RatA of RatAB toxin-antitoxin module